MARIFISYKRADKDKVFPIVEEIKQNTGVDCWIDLEGIESGDQFQNVIINAIDNADIVVFMLSKNFIAPYKEEKTGKVDLKKQTFPEKEVMYALGEGKRLIPLSIDGTTINDCKWLKFNCGGMDCITWDNKNQRDKFVLNIKQWTKTDEEQRANSDKKSSADSVETLNQKKNDDTNHKNISFSLNFIKNKGCALAMTVTFVVCLIVVITGYVSLNQYEYELAVERRFQEQQAIMDSLRTLNGGHISEMTQVGALAPPKTAGDASMNPGTIDNDIIKACLADVYYIRLHKIVLSLNGESVEVDFQISGTGFMLADGHFVTARHVAEPWYYFAIGGQVNENLLMINKVVEQGGSAIGYYTAYSSNGCQFNFTSSDMRVDRSQDKLGEHEGNRFRMAVPCNTDWAYMNMNNGNGKLVADAALSNTLPLQAELTILGYPYSIGAHSENDITPIFAKAIVAKKGLENGRILTTNTTFESGNSGGPVFANKSGKLIVVGIVSAGIGNSTGFIIPISCVYK